MDSAVDAARNAVQQSAGFSKRESALDPSQLEAWKADRTAVLTTVQGDERTLDYLETLFLKRYDSYEEGEQAELFNDANWALVEDGQTEATNFRVWAFQPTDFTLGVVVGRREKTVHALPIFLKAGESHADIPTL